MDKMAVQDYSDEKQQLLESKHQSKDKGYVEPHFIAARHALAFMAFLGFVNVYCLRVNLSVAMVAMVNSTDTDNKTDANECPDPNGNSTKDHTGEFDWNEKTQGYVLGSFFYGYILTQIPGGYLAARIGGKHLFGWGVLCTAALTLVTPIAARYSVYLFIAVRVLEGIGEGVTFPAMHAMWGRWAPVWERSRLVAFTYAGSQLGTVISLPISGLLCDSDFLGGWPSVFYLFGALGCLWFVAWMMLVHNSPSEHPRISQEEREYIETSAGKGEILSTPWKSILTSPAVLCLCVAHFSNNWGFYTLLTCLPTYMKTILKFDMKENGTLSALPYLVMWIVQNLCGFAADYVRSRGYLSTKNTRKVFNTIGFLIPGSVLIVSGYVGCDHVLIMALLTIAVGFGGAMSGAYSVNHLDVAPRYAGVIFPGALLIVSGFVGCSHLLVITFLTLSVGFSGFVYGGFQVNHLDVAPKFAGVLMGLTNATATIPGFLAPAIVGIMTNHNQTMAQWHKIFFINGGVCLFGCIVYNLFAQGEELPWAKVASGTQADPKGLGYPGEIEGKDNPAAIMGGNGPEYDSIQTSGNHIQQDGER